MDVDLSMDYNTWVFWEIEKKDNCWMERGYWKHEGKWQRIHSLDQQCTRQRYIQSHFNEFKEF